MSTDVETRGAGWPEFVMSEEGVLAIAARTVAKLREARAVRVEIEADFDKREISADRRRQMSYEAAKLVVESRRDAGMLDEVAPPTDGSSWREALGRQAEQPEDAQSALS